MASLQKFGGNWTEEKLSIFTSYLEAYLTALQNQIFGKIYIDAFAGTGEIEINDSGQYLIGSAKRALSSKHKFDHYYFIEADSQKVTELQKMVDTEFPQMRQIVTISCGDANNELAQIAQSVNWRHNRGLLFLDPFATQVNWTTLEIVKQTKSIDMWYLFPFYALERMLPKNGKYEKCEDCIDRLLGDSGWREEFYRKDPQKTLFDLSTNEFDQRDGVRKIKDANPDRIRNYIISRLKTIFPCVSERARIFRNSKNSPMFLFCFAIASENPQAQVVALRIADHILKNK